MTIVDSCVIIDITNDDSEWVNWSRESLSAAIEGGDVFAPDIVFAETSLAYDTLEQCQAAWSALGIRMVRLPEAALFRAARAYRQYKQNNGPKDSMLPDFFIGALAEIEGLPILTRDLQRFTTYFPTVQLIAPN